jgi:hypothetical protein
LEGTFNFVIKATDANGCFGTRSYSIVISPPCMFCDEFDDGVLNTGGWTYIKNSSFWSENGTALLGVNTRKTTAVATPAFGGCLNCYAETLMSTAGGLGNRVWLVHHFVDKSNMVELMMKEEQDRWVLKHRVGGRVVAKQKFTAQINPNVAYRARITFDGTNYTASINGTPIITLSPGGPVTPGTAAFKVKSTTGTFQRIEVNP